MSRAARAARSSSWVLAARGAERLVRLAAVVVLARALEARGFGVYSFAFAFAEVFSIFTDAGLKTILVREIARERAAAPRLVGAAIVLKALLAAGVWAVACAAALLTVPAGEGRWSALAATFVLFVSFRVASFRTVFDAPFEADLRMAIPSATGIASEVFSAACLIAAVWARWPIPALIGVQVAALAPGAFFLAAAAAREVRPVLGFDAALWGRLLRAAFPVGAANAFLIAYASSDILMLRWMSGADSAGIYAAAYKLTGSLGIVPLSLTTSLLPLLSEAHGAGDAERVRRIYRGALSLLIAAGLPVALGGVLLAPEIVALLYGPGFAPAAGALRVLAWAVAFQFALYALTTSAVALGRERWFTVYAALLAGLNVALNALLIPRFDFVGASWATLLSEGALLAAGLAVLRPLAGPPPGGPALRALGAAAVGGAALVWLPGPLAVRLCLAAVLYAVLISWGGGLTPEGRAAIGALFRRSGRSAAGEGG